MSLFIVFIYSYSNRPALLLFAEQGERMMVDQLARWMTPPNERGQDAAEYGLLVSLIAVVIIAAVTLLGSNVAAIYSWIATNFP